MNRRWTFTSAVIVAALSVTALPAGAQGRERGGRPGGGGQGGGGQAPRQSAQQAAPRQAPQPQARQSAPPPQARSSQGASRPAESRPYQAPPQSMRTLELRPTPSVPQAAPRMTESRPIPTAPQASPRTAQDRQYQRPLGMPRTSDNSLYSASQAARRGPDNGPSPAAQALPGSPENRQYTGARAVPRAPETNLYSASQAARRGPEGNQSPAAQALPRAEQRTFNGPPAGGRGPGAGDRAGDRAGYRQPPYASHAPNGGYGRPGYGNDHYYYARPYHSQVYVRPPHYVPYHPFRFGFSYYSFHPYWNLGFGLWVGYSVPYPYTYFYGGYAPRVYGTYYSTPYDYSGGDYYGVGSYSATPAVSIYGGVSFDITPSDADVFIDGEYVGPAGTFGPTSEPLTLTPGQHRIAIQRAGFRPMEWDVTIEPGQVIPYRGVMQKY